MAAILMSNFDDQIPRKKTDLIALPGVSDYIASAVRFFAWGFPEALIDTNTVRITSRLFGLEIKDSSRRNANFRKLITALVDQHNPSAYNYALLDLANSLCTKVVSPSCDACPVMTHCLYPAEQKILPEQA